VVSLKPYNGCANVKEGAPLLGGALFREASLVRVKRVCAGHNGDPEHNGDGGLRVHYW